MSQEHTTFSVRVDVTNPGQFFACCGLLELAHRLWPGAEGWFDDGGFSIRASGADEPSLAKLIDQLKQALIVSADPSMKESICPILVSAGFNLRLDWWLDQDGGRRLKTWAGQQGALKIALAMRQELPSAANDLVLDLDVVMTAPYYFDSRRFVHALDTGFSPDEQEMKVVSYPAVELLALIGLQRFRPSTTNVRWGFSYHTWSIPLPPVTAACLCSGAIGGGHGPYCFQTLSRGGDYLKAFKPATKTQQVP